MVDKNAKSEEETPTMAAEAKATEVEAKLQCMRSQRTSGRLTLVEKNKKKELNQTTSKVASNICDFINYHEIKKTRQQNLIILQVKKFAGCREKPRPSPFYFQNDWERDENSMF